MIEHENVRDALKGAFELAKAKSITTEGRMVTVKELQELFEEKLYNIADLLGMEDIYLKKHGGTKMEKEISKELQEIKKLLQVIVSNLEQVKNKPIKILLDGRLLGEKSVSQILPRNNE